jgi:hypothetical protein
MSSRRDHLTFKCSFAMAAFSHADAGAANQSDTVSASAEIGRSSKQAPEFTAIFEINLT